MRECFFHPVNHGMGIWRKEKCVLAAGGRGLSRQERRQEKQRRGDKLILWENRGKQADKCNPREGWVEGGTFRRLGWGCFEEALQGSETDSGTYPVSGKKLWDAFQQWSDMIKIKLLYLF